MPCQRKYNPLNRVFTALFYEKWKIGVSAFGHAICTKADKGDEDQKKGKSTQAYTLFLTRFRIACLNGITLQLLKYIS
jgi:hypothetical protein